MDQVKHDLLRLPPDGTDFGLVFMNAQNLIFVVGYAGDDVSYQDLHIS